MQTKYFYTVSEFISFDQSFHPIALHLIQKTISTDCTIIFCSFISDCGDLYLYFKEALGHPFLHPKDAPDKQM